MSISKSFKKIRYLLDLNQSELALALDISKSLINCYEKNRRCPSRGTLLKVNNLIKERNLESKISIMEFLG